MISLPKSKLSRVLLFVGLTFPALSATVVYSYDNLNRLTRVTYSDNATIMYTYDSAGNRLSKVISNPAVPQSAIGTDKTNLSFSLAPGQTSSAQVVALTNTGGGNLQWNAVSTATWLTVTPSTGTNNAALNVTSSAVGLGPGSYPGSIQVLASASNSPLVISATLNVSGSSTMMLSRTSLNFGVSSSFTTSPQRITVNLTGGLNWAASSNQPNITVSPATGSGTGSFLVTAVAGPSGVITVTAPGATNSPQQVQANVSSTSSGNLYGSFDTPANNTSGIAGAIPVTGWALDNVEVVNAQIWREPIGNEPTAPNNLVFIGNATFVAGARPDVEATYPSAPLNYRAGWGYLLLTNFLPNNGGSPGPGNGTYKLHAIATNKAGNQLDLGTRTIIADNAHASKPFGTIDTPDQGGVASGNSFVNFAWALTQNPYFIPQDGSTLTVQLDGVAIGQPKYNNFRSDIASLFPGLANSNGAVGYFYIDTIKLTNGTHTIAWVVYDNANRGDGIGSRYFNVLNGVSSGNSLAGDEPPVQVMPTEVASLRRGYEPSSEAERIKPSKDGAYSVQIEELDRIELHAGVAAGYMLVNDEQRPLPVGSSLKDGIFYWQLGPGFLGEYQLVLIRQGGEQLKVHVRIGAKTFSSNSN